MDTIIPFLVAVRWVHFASMFLIFGSSAFWVTVGPGRMTAGPRGLPRALASTTRMLRVAAWLAALSGIAWLAGTIANTTGGMANVIDPAMERIFFFETPFGAPAIVRLILLVGLVGIVTIPLERQTLMTATLATSGALLVSQAWLGHAAQGGDSLAGYAMILAYATHVLAGAAWAGGLPVLALAVAERRRASDQRGDALDILFRFSAMALVAVTLVILSGIANTAFRVRESWRVLPATEYGQVLFVKLALVVAMLALAAFNRFVVMARLETRTSARPMRWLRASLALEAGLGLLVVGAAAILGLTPPPH